MKIRVLALSAALAVSAASAAVATDLPSVAAQKKHGQPMSVTIHSNPNPRGGWGGPEWYTKGWGGWGWGYGPGQGLLAGALISAGSTVPYVDFTFGYPRHRRYPYVAFPYGAGYPYYNISYGYYRPPSPH